MKSKNKCVKINKHLKSAEVCPREEKARLVLRFSATLKGQSAALSRRAPLAGEQTGEECLEDLGGY